jgi:Ca-activated chloride channel family protein
MNRILAACVALFCWQASQTPAPAVLKILEPAADAALVGSVTFRVAPIEGMTLVVFEVDGQEACRSDKAPFACDWYAGRSAISHDVRAVARFADGKRLTAAVRTSERPSFSSSGDAVLVPVRVTDNKGRFVPELAADDFVLLEDGRRQPVTIVDSGSDGAEIMLILDISGSMSTIFEELKTTVRSFLGALRPQDKVTLATFNTSLFVMSGRDTTTDQKIAALDKLKPWGYTAIYDTIIRASEMLREQAGRRAIVLFTDGDDISSHATLAGARDALQRNDVLFYLIGTGKAAEERPLRKQLETVAEETGGAAFFAAHIKDTADHFKEVSIDFARQYLLAFQPERPLGDGGWRKLAVSVNNSKKLDVQARAGYIAARRSSGK